MILDQTSKVLRIVLGEPHATNPCDIVSSYADFSLNAGAFLWGNQNALSTGTVAVVVVDAPDVGFQRQVKEVRLFNNDSVPHTVTLQLYDGATAWVVAPSVLSVPVDGAFVYTPDSGVGASSGSGSLWNAGYVTGLLPTLTITGDELGVAALGASTLFGNPGTASDYPTQIAVGTHLTLSPAGTLDAVIGAGLTAALGATINGGTIETNNIVTLAGTAGGTLTIEPGTGTSMVVITMPASGGTVDLVADPQFPGQEWWMSVHQGVTASTINLNTGFVFGTTIPSYTPSGAGLIDDIKCISQDGTHARIEIINKGFSI